MKSQQNRIELVTRPDDRQGYNSSLITDAKWYPGQPNGLHFQPCVAVSSRQTGDPKQWCDLECRYPRCSVCQMPVVQTYLLRGPTHFDQVYALSLDMQLNGTYLLFEGTGTSRIVWHIFEEKTELMNYKLNISLTYAQRPFGLLSLPLNNEPHGQHKWLFTNVRSVRLKTILLNSAKKLTVFIFGYNTVQPKVAIYLLEWQMYCIR